ncbi:MAG: LON peptidase substrate-binding domain-containing protein [Chakrabartia sp.]
MTVATLTRLSVFPLAGAVLFPRMHLPLHIFEPRYRALVQHALASDQRIGMIQPATTGSGPALFGMGCVGKIVHVEALEDGRYNIVLEGQSRFRLVREHEVTTAFRQVEAELLTDPEDQTLGLMERSSIEREARRFADQQGYVVDWEAVTRLDDEALVNGIAQVAPFDPAAKQALLEAPDLGTRADLIVQLMQFFGRHDGDSRVTLQ